jgi:mono/diheme cytochrome c family protein
MKRSLHLFALVLAGALVEFHLIAQSPPSPLDALLKFDADTKEFKAGPGVAQADFTFNLTNISSTDVVITAVTTSCGCTVAKLPAQPWVLAPGSNGEVHATMNLAGKTGTVTKTLTVMTDTNGTKLLFVRSIIFPPPAATADSPAMPVMNRGENQKTALADRQAVFKNDCARCHVEPTRGKLGHELYAAACGICHEGEHRATMVPDLHALKEPTNAEFWKNWIAHGKPGSLMPAFAQSEGGPLSDEQITSLVNFLSTTIPSAPPSPVKTSASTH